MQSPSQVNHPGIQIETPSSESLQNCVLQKDPPTTDGARATNEANPTGIKGLVVASISHFSV